MLRKGLFAMVMLVLCFSFVTAETIKGKITKIDENSVTIVVGKSDGKSYPIAKDCKFNQTVKKDDKEVKEKIEGGAKASVFAKLPEKGLNATIVTDDKTKAVTEIVLPVKKK